ncbi:MAG: Glu-tRNA(Gln) amidotransferase GatDE subunit D [Crenarchaeota archaeon]|nr:MAG: Glu-tRNA(Gln) amidotransferase GatDE subunit D [Thermoproteota archaeon]RDJ33372.1 MAG: Glu-tRNA(Gln) amidotransferase GatDE subunit D [Thermoproteota archaeon]RDJ36123.1 MAG: Glu-tRNA(Gln) amidotransferase GatDE subunit D [Thermoproteota archaeon]RDJ38755.1 MAG: Glu-tRNA(Gln) amidotransferase GatDE subunit D [Thermoproteota archaeon]
MSEYRGYQGRSLEFLQKNNIKIGSKVKIFSDIVYDGIIMPRYEKSDSNHITLKLKSGYNIGLEIDKIEKIEKLESLEIKTEHKRPIEKKANLEKILLISTGGTIASKIDYRTGAVTPALSPEELNSSIPELAEMANIDTELILSEYSENLQPKDWKRIAQKLDDYSNSDYKGIIVAHGTDTMHYTSAFLSFALSGYPIPIALVGSQRSSDRPSSDAALNLIAAVKFLTEANEKGVYVIMHNDENDKTIACHLGTRVRKNHTSKRGAFQTIGGNPGFLIVENSIQKNITKKFFQTEKYLPRINVDSRVALLKYYPGFDPRIVENLIDLGHKAIIFEGTGLGHIGKNMYEVVKSANQSGLFLGMTSQCIDGKVRMTVYESGRDLMDMGIIPLGNLIPEVALVKAMWALGNTEDISKIKEIMLQEISSEYSN